MKHGPHQVLVRMWNIQNAHALLVGVEIGVSHVENSLALHTTAEHDPAIPLLTMPPWKSAHTCTKRYGLFLILPN